MSRIVVVESLVVAIQYLLKLLGVLVALFQHVFRPQHVSSRLRHASFRVRCVSFRHRYVVARHELLDQLPFSRVVVVLLDYLDFQE